MSNETVEDTQLEEKVEWHIINAPSSIELTSVGKESGTHGQVYTLWEIERQLPVWVSQSIPAVVEHINKRATHTTEKKLHASSLYRVLRGESVKQAHKNWKVARWARNELGPLNEHIKLFPSCIFVSKAPDYWKVSKATLPPTDPESAQPD
jgi:hypothetical protein